MNDAATSQETLCPFPPGADYFHVLALPRRMNLDPRALEETFHALSRRYHPDRYATAEPRLRRISLENSALVNKAYRTLRDPWERAAYVVGLAEGRSGPIEARPPDELLEDILELQEVLSDLRMTVAGEEPDEELKRHALRAAEPFRRAHDALDARLQSLSDEWDAAEETDRPDIAKRLKELLGERRYLRRVVADIDAALEGRPAPRDL
jgi:molecular chaperone HscB